MANHERDELPMSDDDRGSGFFTGPSIAGQLLREIRSVNDKIGTIAERMSRIEGDIKHADRSEDIKALRADLTTERNERVALANSHTALKTQVTVVLAIFGGILAAIGIPLLRAALH